MNAFETLSLTSLVITSVVFCRYVRRTSRIIVKPVIAGNVNIHIDEEDLQETEMFALNNFIFGDKIVRIDASTSIYYLAGKSLELFGLCDKQKVLVKPLNEPSKNLRRGDILVLKTQAKPNRNRLKSSVCLGFWGDPDQPDEDLIKYENYSGTVREYFQIESPRKYGSDELYDKRIEGYLKILSCAQDIGSNRKHISRPHDPSLICGRVEYVIEA